MIRRILEIGVAVRDVKESAQKFQRTFGAYNGEVIHVPEYKMVMQMFRVGNVDVELMEPTDSNSVIARFLKSRGEGFHHIAFQVEDIKNSVKWMKKHEVEIVNEEVFLMGSLKAVFLDPISLGGVLVELIEGDPTWVRGCVLPSGLETGNEVQGIQAEGIEEVVILVRDLEAATALYSEVFLLSSVEAIQRPEVHIITTTFKLGNVVLRLMQAEGPRKDAGETTTHHVGIHSITAKVRNIQDAICYLNSKEIKYFNAPAGKWFAKEVVAIDAKELSGALIMIV